MDADTQKRLDAANSALQFFAKETRLELRNGRVWVTWDRWDKTGTISKQWQVRSGQSFYPVWSRIWPHGGTCTTAMSQLVRWVQGKPVLPISSWQYWCSDKILIARERGPELVDLLLSNGYPEHVSCVLCKTTIEGSLDWWNLGKVSGPCCGWTSGCRQKTAESES